MAKYKHLVAGSTFIMPNGKTIRFHGKSGGTGEYETNDADEIAELDKLDKAVTAQVARVAEDAPESTEFTKAADPAIEQAAKDAAEASARVTTQPTVASAQENLAKTIAAAKGQ